MKNTIKDIWKLLAAAVLGLLGFASCEIIGVGRVMYGEPHADFKALGKVSDEAGNPIEGIRVAISQHRHYDNTPEVIFDQNDWYDNDTVFTDDKGSYLLDRSVFSAPDDVTIVFEDVDGEEHGGEFLPETLKTVVVRTKKGDKNWYSGAFEAKIDATLKKNPTTGQ